MLIYLFGNDQIFFNFNNIDQIKCANWQHRICVGRSKDNAYKGGQEN